MVGHLEHERRERAAALQEERLAARAQVARQQQGHAAPVEAQHERLVVGGQRRPRRRPEHGEERVSQPDPLTGGERAPGHPRAGQRRHRVERPDGRAAALPELAHPEAREHRGQPARVIDVPVGEGDDVQVTDRPIPEKRREHALAHVEPARPARAAVHQHAWPVGQLDQDRVALAHVEEGHPERTIGEGEPGPRRQCRDGEQQEAQQRAAAARPRDPGRQQQGGIPRERRGEHGRRQVHHRARERGGQGHERAQDQQDEPEAVEEQGPARAREQLHHQGRHAERGGHRGERHHCEIGDDADQRELVEVRRHERGDRGLRAQADRRRAGEPGRPAPHGQALGQPRCEVDDARGRRERELEAGLPEIAGPPEQQEERGERQGVGELGLPLEQERGEQEQAHHGGPQHRGLAAHHQREADQHHRRDHRDRPARDPAEREAAEHRAGQERHVEARHREDVIDARPPECLVTRGRQRGALPQQEPGEERGGGLGQARRDHVHRPALHRHPPGRRVRGERGEPLRARVPDEQDALATEMSRVVEAARIAIADRGMHASVHEHPLPLTERGSHLSVDRELHAPGGAQALRAEVHGLRVK